MEKTSYLLLTCFSKVRYTKQTTRSEARASVASVDMKVVYCDSQAGEAQAWDQTGKDGRSDGRLLRLCASLPPIYGGR